MTFNIDIIIVLVLFALDAASTLYGVTSGKAVESWPPTKWLMGKIGVVPALVVLKAVAVACFLVPTLTPYMIGIVTGMYGFVVANNLLVLWNKRKK